MDDSTENLLQEALARHGAALAAEREAAEEAARIAEEERQKQVAVHLQWARAHKMLLRATDELNSRLENHSLAFIIEEKDPSDEFIAELDVVLSGLKTDYVLHICVDRLGFMVDREDDFHQTSEVQEATEEGFTDLLVNFLDHKI